MTSALFQPIRLRGLSLENRVMVSPMCQYSAVDGSANDWHLIHLGHLSLGGAGILFAEATAVEPTGRITPGCLGLYSADNEAALGRVVKAVRAQSGIAFGIQLAHAGRKGSSREPWNGGALIPVDQGGWVPVAPSPIPHAEGEPQPHSLSASEMAAIRDRFVDSVRRALRLGFNAIEVHSAHGYLLHEFLSPVSNRREDRYGGSRENRMRYPLEVFAAMRAAWPQDRPMGVRVSCTDWVEGGWTIADTIAFAKELKRLGCDWIDASSGGVSTRQQIALGPGYHVPFAEAIRRESGMTTIAVGLITEPRQAEEIVASGKADMVALARAMLYDPRWAWHAAAELGGQVRAPRQYMRSPPRGVHGLFGEVKVGQR